MNSMVVGERGFLDGDGIYFINGKCYIDTNFSISPKKSEIHILPVERFGPEKGDFELDFFIAQIFFSKFSTKEMCDILHDEAVMLIEDIEIELADPFNYQVQIIPRMDWEELIENFIANNQALEDSPDDQTTIEDQEVLRKYIKEKIFKFDISELKTHEKKFTESTRDRAINFLADEDILQYITKRIATLEKEQKFKKEKTTEAIKDQTLKNISMDELKTALDESISREDYIQASLIRDEMEKRQKIEKK